MTLGDEIAVAAAVTAITTQPFLSTPDSCGPLGSAAGRPNRRGRTGVPVYSPMRSAITSICRPKNSALASITLLNWPESSKLTMPNS